ncbi:unnamed protein product, partial [Mesorhabditis belari]|uniref:Major facilitator superfamily (MFS) profile domain-containing protein n=1 Tax=Mesorhabditis belari TaxID=2138241 RepID=A0AAF3J987_9BILA
MSVSHSHLPPRILPIAFLVSLGGSFHFGYQLVITNPTQAVFLDFVNQTHYTHYGKRLDKGTLDIVWSGIVAVVFLGALFGSFALRIVAERLGRKSGLLTGISLALLSVGLSIFSHTLSSYEIYTFSRFLLGVAISVNMGLGAMYLVEICPKESRGKVGMMTGSLVQAGTVAGSIVALPQVLGTSSLWPMIYVVELLCLALPFFALIYLPESPSFLVKKGEMKKARKALAYFHSLSEDEVTEQIDELRNELEESSQRKVGMIAVLKKKGLRRRVFVGMIVAFVMAFSGIAVINGYAVEILMNTGLNRLNASLANLGFNALSMFAIFGGAMVVDKFGRRPLLLFTSTGILVTNLIIVALMFAYAGTENHIYGLLLVIMIGVFTIFFAAGPGPLCYFISAELVDTHARSGAQAWTSVVQMASRTFLLSIYLPLKNLMGNSSTYLLLFVFPVLLSIIILYFRLPETKKKSPSEVTEAEQKLPKLWCSGGNLDEKTRVETPEV